MQIREHLIASTYGYGVLRWTLYLGPGFIPHLEGSDLIGERIIQPSPDRIAINNMYVPLFLVCSDTDGRLYEYLTGRYIRCETSKAQESSGDIFCDTLTVVEPRVVTAQDFAKNLAQYTEEDLRKIAAGVRKLYDDAPKWAQNHAQAKRSAEQALKNATNGLADGFGRYGS